MLRTGRKEAWKGRDFEVQGRFRTFTLGGGATFAVGFPSTSELRSVFVCPVSEAGVSSSPKSLGVPFNSTASPPLVLPTPSALSLPFLPATSSVFTKSCPRRS